MPWSYRHCHRHCHWLGHNHHHAGHCHAYGQYIGRRLIVINWSLVTPANNTNIITPLIIYVIIIAIRHLFHTPLSLMPVTHIINTIPLNNTNFTSAWFGHQYWSFGHHHHIIATHQLIIIDHFHYFIFLIIISLLHHYLPLFYLSSLSIIFIIYILLYIIIIIFHYFFIISLISLSLSFHTHYFIIT